MKLLIFLQLHSRQMDFKWHLEKIYNKSKSADESGVRTHARRLVPKTSALDHSAISPMDELSKRQSMNYTIFTNEL